MLIGQKTHHQVKRQRTTGRWTLAELARDGVLEFFRTKVMSEPGANCVFVSMCDAPQLRELSERARSSQSLEEFRAQFLNSKDLARAFGDLCTRWDSCSETVALDALRRLEIATISEDLLCDLVDAKLEVVVDERPDTVRDVLAQYALDNVHKELRAADLHGVLAQRQFRLRDWTADGELRTRIAERTEEYLNRLCRALIGDKLFAREESQHVLRALEGNNVRQILVAGSAGAGKSTVIFEVVEAVRRQGWPILVIRADNCEAAQRETPRELGEALNLKASPAAALAGLADGNPALLVVDQLDALSFASGRHHERLDVLLSCIEQARHYPNVRVLLGCRIFDIENDDRLRRYVEASKARRVDVNPLPSDAIDNVLRHLHLDPERFSEEQRNILSSPLHLTLLAAVVGDNASAAPAFATANDLFDAYWTRKERDARARSGSAIDFTGVMDRLCAYLSEHQTLSAPDHVLDHLRLDASVLSSEHVLVHQDRSVAFFHESFFDYVFARRFATSGNNLVEWLLASGQHLFRRAQVRQILTWLRANDRRTYLDALGGLLVHPQIRTHIKQLVAGLLRHVEQPEEDEWSLLDRVPVGPGHAMPDLAWRVVYGRPQWISLIDRLGVLHRLLRSANANDVDAAVQLLFSVQRELPDVVATRLQEHCDDTAEWRQRVRSVVGSGKVGASRSFFEATVHFLERGMLDGLIQESHDAFGLMAHDLPQEHPAWGCELLGAYIRRLRARPELDAGRRFLDGISVAGGHFEALVDWMVQGAPRAFVEQLLPSMLQYMVEARKDSPGGPPWTDEIWWYRPEGERLRASAVLLDGMERALKRLAREAPEVFAAKADGLVASDSETAWHLLLTGYTGHPERFAESAWQFLREHSVMLLGSLGAPYSAPRAWISTIAPQVSPARLQDFEGLLLEYVPEHERRADTRDLRGSAQRALLSALPAALQSDRVKRRLQELERKLGPFTETTENRVARSRVRQLTAAVPGTRAQTLSDDDWLRVIERFSKDRIEHIGEDDYADGAFSQALELAKCTKAEPQRFAAFLHRMPEASHPAYFNAILGGLVGHVDDRELLRAVARCHTLPDHPLGIELCRTLRDLRKPVATEAIDVVAWYATHGEGPRGDSIADLNDESDRPGRDLWHAGMNCVRGAAAEAVGQWLWNNVTTFEDARPLLQQLAQDPSSAVRSCVVEALVPLLNIDRDEAVALFVSVCSNTEDALLATPPVEKFLYYSACTHYEQMLPLVDRMLCSSLPPVATKGAQLRAFAALTLENHRGRLDELLAGEEPIRLGVAQQLAAMLTETRDRARCELGLRQLFDDPAPTVREAAANWIESLDESDRIEDYDDLLRALVDSAAFAGNRVMLLHRLQQAARLPPTTALFIAQRFIDEVGTKVGSPATAEALEARELGTIIVRLYAQSKDEGVRNACLDVIDRFAEMNDYRFEQTLEHVER